MVVSDLLLTPDATPSTLAADRRAGPGPRHLGRPRHPHHRRQPVRPDRVRRPAAARPAGPSTPTRPWPGRSSASSPVDERRILRQRGTHEPEDIARGLRDPSTAPPTWWPAWPRPASSTSAPSTSTCRPAPASGWSGSSPAPHVYDDGPIDAAPGPTADTKPGRRLTAAGRHWRDLVHESPEDAPWLDGRAPAERPVGPVPVRRLAHPLPAVRPLRLVAARPLRRGPPAAGGGHPVAARPPRDAACRPGPCATPTPPTSTTSW